MRTFQLLAAILISVIDDDALFSIAALLGRSRRAWARHIRYLFIDFALAIFLALPFIGHDILRHMDLFWFLLDARHDDFH